MILPHLIVVVLLEKSVLPSVAVLDKAVVEPYTQVVVQEVAWAQIC